MSEAREIAIALVPPKHQQLFMTNANFRHRVETLARLLPEWIDGMAGAAEKEAYSTPTDLETLMSLGVVTKEKFNDV